MFKGISAVDKTVTADDSKIPTSGAIVNYVTDLGAGDMQKAVYDKDNTGIVDDAKKLGGVAPEEYLQKESLPETAVTFEEAETRSNISTGEKVSTVFGKIKKFFADLTASAFAQMITDKDDLLATKVTGYVPDAKAVADAVTEVNGKLIVPDYENAVKITLPYTAENNGYIVVANMKLVTLKIGNMLVYTNGTVSTTYASRGIIPIAKGNILSLVDGEAYALHFIPIK